MEVIKKIDDTTIKNIRQKINEFKQILNKLHRSRYYDTEDVKKQMEDAVKTYMNLLKEKQREKKNGTNDKPTEVTSTGGKRRKSRRNRKSKKTKQSRKNRKKSKRTSRR